MELIRYFGGFFGMSIPEFIHNFSWILILLVTVMGLTTNQIQQVIISLYTDRALYIVMVGSNLLLMVHTVAMSPVLVILKFLLGLATLGVIELLFARKQRAGSIKINQIQLLSVLAALTMLVGLVIDLTVG
ncbi:hypothetical protein PECL_938 [Pediococcus claussenii ATCC BAA-344]|uniref:Uncharacterized protein n=2 Tax=Pediococcus claussenii TaxID=187452 RepID=G8PD72_PEDCP|nr:hypothetical protein PECL_938 [Pediococcus claussenii ATCC BAA-344]KRN19610.1 hypothetical protein IV79_GL001327 [Pediococcus claussenii]